MPFPIIAQIAISIGLQVIGYLLMPRPKPPKPPAVEDLQDPTAEAGRPIPVVFGSMTVTGLNVLYYGEKAISVRKVKIGK